MKQNYFNAEKTALSLKLSKIIRLLLTTLFLVVLNSTVKAQSNIDENYIILNINSGADTYYDLQANTANTDFQGLNLGTFLSTDALIIKGAQNKVHKCDTDDITSGNLFYRIYETTNPTPPLFTSTPIPWLLDSAITLPCTGIAQVWEPFPLQSINVLSSLTPGTYYLEVYTNADFTYSTGNGTHYANNSGANYKAQFTLLANCVTDISVIPSTVLPVCVGSTAATLTATITTASGSGDANITYEWFSNTSNSTISGTPVQTVPTTTATLNSTYTPSTVIAGTLWYYCTVTNTDATCSGSYSTIPVEVVVNTPSVAPTSITGITTICSGDSTTLTLSGGTAGTGATEEWFTGSCGGTSVGTGTNSITVSPTATTTYYVRYSGFCNATTCASVTVTVEPIFIAGAINTTGETICYNGDPANITSATIASGGDGAITYEWRADGIPIASSNSSTFDPPTGLTATTTYTRWAKDNTCNATFTQSTGSWVVTVEPNFTDGAINTTGETICYNGDPINITSATVASGGDGSITYKWQANGIDIASSNSSTFDPPTGLTATTTYTRWAKDNTCNATFTQSAGSWVVTVNPIFTDGAINTTGETICYNGDPINITSATVASGGDGSITYKWQANGIDIASSNSSSYDPPTGLTATTTYTRWAKDNICNTTFTQSAGSWVVTVNPLPTAAGAISGALTVCQGLSGVTYSVSTITNASSYSWTYSGTGVTISDPTIINPTLTFASNATSGILNVQGINACGNGAVSANFLITVTPTVGTPTAITISAGVEPTCQLTNGTTTTTYATTATNTTGFNWSLSNGAAGAIGATTGVMTWANGFSGTVNIQVTANGCNGPSAQVVRTVTVTPTVGTPTAITISAGTQPTCQLTNGTTTTTYTTTATNNTGFNWSLSNGAAGAIGATTGVMTWANGFSGTVNIQVTANGCNGPSAQVVRTVTVTPTVGTPTAITISAGTQPTCQLTNGTTTTTYATTATNTTGFNWSLSNGAAGAIGATTGVMTWANGFSGTVNIQVTANGCNGPSAQVVRTVTVTPTVGTPTAITISAGTQPTCQLTNGTTTTTYTTTATNNTGFNWSLSNGAAGAIGATTGVMTWANGFSGTVDIRVTANGCNGPTSPVVTRTVTVNASPVVTAPATLCVGSTATLSPTTGGTWTSSNNALATVTNAGVINGIAPGVVSFTFTLTSTGCSVSTSSVSVIALPVISSITATAPTICIGSSSNLTAAVSGGVASTIVNYDFNSGGSYGTLAPVLATNVTSTVSSTNIAFNTATGIASGASFTPNVTAGNALNDTNPAGSWVFTLGGIGLPAYSTFKIYFQAQRANGGANDIVAAFSKDGGASLNIGTVTLTNSGQWYEGSFTLAASANNPTSTLAITLTVGNTGTGDVKIDNFQVQAASSNTTFSWVGSPAGTAGLPATAGNPLVTNNNINVNPTATTNYTVTATNSNGCQQTSNVTVTVNPLPVAAGSITGTSIVCQGQSAVGYSVPIITNATSYMWAYSGTGATITGTTNTPTITFAVNATSGNLTVRGTNACGNGIISANYPITVNPLPVAAGSITGTATVCQGQSGVAYSVAAITNATAYSWIYSGTGVTFSDSTIRNPTITFATNATSGILTVRGINACGNGAISANYTITVNPLPLAAGTITGSPTVCQGQNGVAYSVVAITNATSYTWVYTGTGATISGAVRNPTINFAATATSGNLTVSGTNGCGNGTVSAIYAITVNPLPVAAGSITGTSTVCQGQSAVGYSVPIITNATSYTWAYSGTGATITGTTNTPTITFAVNATSGNLTVRGTNACGNGIISANYPITVNPLPVAASSITGTATVCQGQSGVAYSVAAITNATAYSWTYSGTGVTFSDSTVRNPTLTFATNATSGNLTVRGTNACGNGTISANYAITVNSLPVITIQPAIPADVCTSGGVRTISVTATGVTTYQWRRNGVNLANVAPYSNATTATLTITNPALAIAGNFDVILNSATCPVTSNAVALTIYAQPNAGTDGATTVCDNNITPINLFSLITGEQAGGTWTQNTGTGGTFDAVGGTFTPAIGASSSSFTYSLTGTAPCVDDSSVATITIISQPDAGTDGAITICDNSVAVIDLFGLISGEQAGGVWSRTTGTGGTFSAVAGTFTPAFGATSSTFTYTLTGTAPCINNDTSVATITIDPTPIIPDQAITFCSDDVFTVIPVNGFPTAATVVPANTTYSWSLPVVTGGITGGTAQTGQTSISDLLSNPTIVTQTATYTVTPTSGSCVGATFKVVVTVTASPDILNLTPQVCSGETLTITPVNGGGNIVPSGTTYSWGIPSVTGGMTGGAIGTNQASISMTLTNPTNIPQIATYAVTAKAGSCIDNTFTISVTVYPKPTASGDIVNQNICSGSPIAPITISNPNGVSGIITYNWTRDNTINITGIPNGSGSSITGTLINTTGVPQTTTFSLYATSSNGCVSLPSTVTVVVDPVPTVAATPVSQPICSENGISTITITNPNNVIGTTFSWTRNNTVNITGIPDGSGSTITGSLTNITNVQQTTIFTITATANGCNSTTTVTVIVNPKPTVDVSLATQTVCGGSPFTNISITNPNGVSGTTYTWTRVNTTNLTGVANSGSGNTISGTFVNNTNSVQTETFTIIASASGCPSTSITATVTVNPTPLIVITPATPANICSATAMATLTLSNSNNVAGTVYSWTRDKTTEITGIGASGSGSTISATLTNTTAVAQTTTFTVTATAPNGCFSTKTVSVTVYAPLVASVISSAQTVCVLSTPATLTATLPTGGSGGYTYQWQRSPNASGGPWTNVGGNSLSYTPGFINFGDNDSYYQLVISNSCGTVTSNTIWVEVITNVGFTFDLTGLPGTLCPNSSFTPNISAVHLITSYVRYVWSANSAYISPATGGPVGTTDFVFFFGVSSADIGPLTAINNTNATITTTVTLTPNVYNSGTNAFICSATPSNFNVTIRPTPKVTTTVPNTTICSGSSANIAVKGNITDATMTFAWSRDNSANVSGPTSGNSGVIAVGGTYTIPNTLTNISGSAQNVIYTITPSSNGCNGTPIQVTITVVRSLTPGAVVANQTVCNGGDPAAFTETIAATGNVLTYQWQSSTSSATGPWTNIGGATASVYDAPSGLTQTTWYQRVVTSTLNGVTCDVANAVAIQVTVNTINPGSVTGDQTLCSSGDPTLFASVAATGGGTISYQWQSNTTGCGGVWADISGANAATYDAPSGLTLTTYYRRIAISTLNTIACSAYSNCITVSVNNVTAGTVNGDQTICGSNPIAFTESVVATGSGTLSYTWERNTTGCGGVWNVIPGATSATYTPSGLLVTTYYHRITVSTLNGVACSAIGNCITVTINSVTGGAIAANRTVCSGGDPAAFTESVAATGTNLTYQWQNSTVSGVGPWTSIPLATSSTYDAPSVSQTTFYQRVTYSTINSLSCSAVSNSVTVFVNDVSPSTIAGSQSVCGSADPVAFTVSTPALGAGAVTYQWQSNTTGCGGSWNAIPGATSAIYDAGPVAQTTYYQVVITSIMNGVQCTTVSNCVVITYIILPPTPIVGTMTQPDCIIPTGSVVLSGLPAGSWTINPGGITGNTASVTVSGLAANTYNFTVSNGTCTSLPSANVVIQPASLAIWNGSGWINGPPTSNQPLEFTGSYNSTGDLTACSCTVTSGAVVFKPTHTLKITNWVHVNGGSLTFDDTASLVQINNVSNTNLGNITYKRQTTVISNMDYTYWSTPVLPFTLGGVSPLTLGDKFYSYDANIDNWKQESPATSMVSGIGYIIRGPQTYQFPNPPSIYEAPFVGVPNNGHYEILGIIADKSYLIGNPYPSALDADTFLDANQNVLDGTLYFWTHNTPIAVGTPNPGTGLFAYSGDDYASYNRTGGVSTAAPAPSSIPPFTGLNSNIPTGKIASGQGFFGGSKVAPIGTSIIFDNNMRVGVGGITGDNSQFFKTKNPKITKANTIEKHRIWLDLTNTQGAFKQTLVGYITYATNGYEGRFDGESYDGNDFLDFYSILQDKNLVIQGRALPFDENDEVPLGYRVAVDGTFTITIDQTDGLLMNQAVYLEDKLANRVFNLKGGNYTFATAAGTFNDRFVLKYTDKTLSIDETENDGIIVLYSNNYKTLIIRNSIKDATVNSVTLYNMRGQKIAYWDVKGREQSSIQIPIKNLAAEIYIVKVKTTKGESTKKIIIK